MNQNGFTARVIRTNKIEVNGKSHGLPPHKGGCKEFKVADYHCPEEWSNDGVFIKVKEGEPLWFDFRDNNDECAVLCAVQRINPVTGDPADLDEGLSKDPTQNYLRMPEQKWLDGYAKDGKVYQFVVTKAGIGLAVNEHLLPAHMQDSHAIGFAFFGPKNPKPKPAPVVHHYHEPSWHVITDNCYAGNLIRSAARNYIGMSSSGGTGNLDSSTISEAISAGGIQATRYSADDITINADNTKCVNVNTVMVAQTEIDAAVETVDILAEQEANLNELEKASMGAGGRISQSIITDDNTTDYYHEKRSALLTIYFALPEMYDAIMEKGKRQDASKKDKYKNSGHIGGVAIPLIGKND